MKKIPQMKSGVVFAMASAKPLPPAPVALAGQHVAPEILAAHTAWVKGSKEIAGLMLMTMEPEIQRNLENLPYANTCEVVKSSCLHQQAEQELLQTTAVNFTRLRPRHLKRNSPRGGGGSTCSQVAKEEKERGGGPSGAGGGVQGCFGLRASRKLKPGALSLYVGNGQREAVEAIGNFELSFPSRLVIDNCHYAPSITRGVISVSRLYEDGFINRFVNNTIHVSRNNMVCFSAIPTDEHF
ncbi:hypothetical protein Tco_1110920 [Tanacetum coccineum]|uniref:Uncharacterized protein n=1 Tax=Tanacetum coccineum TaxID=301880 RepID=A0ABQ5IK84_9ASTR